MKTCGECRYSFTYSWPRRYNGGEWSASHSGRFILQRRQSLVGIGFESRQGPGIFLSTTAFRPTLGPTQYPIRWVPGAVSLGVKRPWRKTDHSLPSSAEVKNAWSYTSTPQHGAQLKQRDEQCIRLWKGRSVTCVHSRVLPRRCKCRMSLLLYSLMQYWPSDILPMSFIWSDSSVRVTDILLFVTRTCFNLAHFALLRIYYRYTNKY
jgi:hypothetical protein